MNKKVLALCLFVFVIVFFAGFFLFGQNFAVLNPQGVVAAKQRTLLITATAIISLLIIPSMFLAFYFASKFRADKQEHYAPDWGSDSKIQFLWWLIPIAVVSLLAFINWRSSHDLDPFKPLEDKEPLTIQVVALQWKWLFLYPEQNIATVNFVQFPVGTPVRFELTSDGPMNSFWIPQLAGQMYAMTGMKTQLNLMANNPGEFRGSAAEINGAGFSGMSFVAKASTNFGFDQWVKSIKGSYRVLTEQEYDDLAKPSLESSVAYFSSQEGVFSSVLDKYSNHVKDH